MSDKQITKQVNPYTVNFAGVTYVAEDHCIAL